MSVICEWPCGGFSANSQEPISRAGIFRPSAKLKNNTLLHTLSCCVPKTLSKFLLSCHQIRLQSRGKACWYTSLETLKKSFLMLVCFGQLAGNHNIFVCIDASDRKAANQTAEPTSMKLNTFNDTYPLTFANMLTRSNYSMEARHACRIIESNRTDQKRKAKPDDLLRCSCKLIKDTG